MSAEVTAARLTLAAAVIGLVGAVLAAPWWVGPATTSPTAATTASERLATQPRVNARPPQLDLSEAVASRCPTWGTDDGWEYGEYQVGSTIIQDALLCSMWDAKQDAEDWATSEYLLPSGTKNLEATLGLANETESTELRLQVLVTYPVTGGVLHKGTATYGQPIQVRASVENTIRISFRARIINPGDDADGYAHFVLGNVVLT